MSATANTLESRLLSAIMKGPESMDSALSMGVREDVFTNAQNRTLFVAMKMAASNGSLSIDEVFAHLPSESRNQETIQLLVEIAGIEATSISLQALVLEVVGTWKKSALLRSALIIAEVASKPSRWEDVWPEASSQLSSIESIASAVEIETNQTLAAKAKASFLARKRGDNDYGVSFGFAAVDRIATKIKPGEFVLLAARPSGGKSTLAGQITMNLVRHGGRVAVFNLETRSDQFYDRSVIHMLGIPEADAWGARVAQFESAYDEIGEIGGLYVFDKIHDLDSIEVRIRSLCAGKRLDLAVIDYIQQVRVVGGKKDWSREREVAEVSRRLKLLTNITKCPIIAIAQFNREAVKDNQIPKMHHLRDSGSLEQDADRILILHHEPVEDGMPDDRTNVETALIQEKAKDAPRGVAFKLMFNRPTYTFRHMDTNQP